MRRLLPTLLLLALLIIQSANAQKDRILLDGQFDDWVNRDFLYSDPIGDGRFGYDFSEFIIENDEHFICFSFD